MSNESGQLQVYFEAPFWVGVFEQISEGKLTVCKVTFGAEPGNADILEFIRSHYHRLQFGPPIDFDGKQYNRLNPKRIQRQVRKKMEDVGAGTKAQQALKLQNEQKKQEQKVRLNKRNEAEKQYRFDLKQQKKKEKHKGR